MSWIFWVLLIVTLLLLIPLFTALAPIIKFVFWLLASVLIVMDMLWLTAVITRAGSQAPPVSPET